MPDYQTRKNPIGSEKSLAEIVAKNQHRLKKVEDWVESKKRNQLKYPLDDDSEKLIFREIKSYIANNILDIFARKVLHYLTFFESITGYTQAGTVAADGQKVLITTTNVNGNIAYILKEPRDVKYTDSSSNANGLLDFGLIGFCKYGFQIADVTNVTAYLVAGKAILNATGDKYYGFKIVNSTLYAVASNNGTGSEQTLSLGTISAGTVYVVEARLYPNNKIIFFLNPTNPDPSPKAVLTDTTKFPTGQVTTLHSVAVQTNAAVTKSIEASFVQIFQALTLK